MAGQPFGEYLLPQDRAAFGEELRRLAGEQLPGPAGRCLVRAADGRGPLELSGAVVRETEGGPACCLWALREPHWPGPRAVMSALGHAARNTVQRAHAGLERLQWRLADRPDLLELVARVLKAQEDLVRLLDQAQDLVGPLRLNPRRLDLGDVWREAWARAAAPHSSARLREQEQTADRTCEGDPAWLSRGLRDLFGHFLGTCPPPAVVELTLREGVLPTGTAIQLHLRCAGPEGPGESLGPDPLHSLRAWNGGPVGFGMAIAKKVAEAHGGQLTAGAGADNGVVLSLPRRVS
jgi:two-component system sensor histidine kinase BaeS